MRANHAVSRVRLGCVSLLVTALLAGCGGSGKEEGPPTGDNPKTGSRRKEMSDFMKNQQANDGKAKP